MFFIVTAPPPPESYPQGLDPATTRLEVFTEFIEAPEVSVTPVVLQAEADPILRQLMVEPDLIDQRLDFGPIQMGQGRAFSLGASDPLEGDSVLTGKSLEWIDGRLFLIEKVNYSEIQGHLSQLEQHAAVDPLNRLPRGPAVLQHDMQAGGIRPPALLEFDQAYAANRTRSSFRASIAGTLPVPAAQTGTWTAKDYAKADVLGSKGLVLDWIAMSGSLTNYVLRGDSSYFIAASTYFNGTTVIKGNSVLKATNAAWIQFNGPIDARTGPGRPMTVTAWTDDSIGEKIPGSSGSPSGTYAAYAMRCTDTTTTYDLHDIYIRYANFGFTFHNAVRANLRHAQVSRSTNAVAFLGKNAVTSRNVLIHDSTTAFYFHTDATNRIEHATVHRVKNFRGSTNGLPAVSEFVTSKPGLNTLQGGGGGNGGGSP